MVCLDSWLSIALHCRALRKARSAPTYERTSYAIALAEARVLAPLLSGFPLGRGTRRNLRKSRNRHGQLCLVCLRLLLLAIALLLTFSHDFHLMMERALSSLRVFERVT